MKKKAVVLGFLMGLFQSQLYAQGCSDAGFCTIGNNGGPPHNNSKPASITKNEVDILYTYGTHGKQERYYQPQINYRRIKTNGSFFELRLPVNSARNKSTGISNTGIGDLIMSYNNSIMLAHKNKVDYSAGLRISLSDASKGDGQTLASYPMYLQKGLGTADVIIVGNYNIAKFASIGTGLQVPVVQYNKNVRYITGYGADSIASGYRRKADALLKLNAFYAIKGFKITGGLLGIFHLANDHYNTSNSKYILYNSKGTTINWSIEINYAVTRRLRLGVLMAQPLKTRQNIPDGLARFSITSAKITVAF